MSANNLNGFVAAGSFLLFTGVGASAQVLKLYRRTKEWKLGKLERREICDGLLPAREMLSFSAFTLFALSGLTRTYLDYFLFVSRLPVIILSTIVLWFLQFHGERGARKIYFYALGCNLMLLFVIGITFSGSRIDHSLIQSLVDGALSVVSISLFFGKQMQAIGMYRYKRSRAVSWFREGGLVIKDLAGLWYSLSIGSELLWVSVTHVLSAVSSFTICVVKYLVERPSPKKTS